MTQEAIQTMGTSTRTNITVRGLDLTSELIGKTTLTDLFFLEIVGRLPDDRERTLLDAVLVTLVEHGITANAIAARLTHLASPDAVQASVAAGILGAGTVYLGAIDACAEMLQRAVGSDDVDAAVDEIVDGAKSAGMKIPGIGHPLHKPDDPRTLRLYELADDVNLPDAHRLALDKIRSRAEEVFDRSPLPVNADGAIAAVLSDIGFSWRICRGVAIVARSAGLVGHLWDEMNRPVANRIWDVSEAAIDYVDPSADF